MTIRMRRARCRMAPSSVAPLGFRVAGTTSGLASLYRTCTLPSDSPICRRTTTCICSPTRSPTRAAHHQLGHAGAGLGSSIRYCTTCGYVIEVVDDRAFECPGHAVRARGLGSRRHGRAHPGTNARNRRPCQPPPRCPAASPGRRVRAVVGQTPNSASRLMRDAGLVIEVASADAFSPGGAGSVATQDPQPATRVAPGTSVRLGVAAGA